ncbi:MAG: TonB-dependent receptor [Acidobacteria bacterium]|nr:TonB-dependent receptor [Acidobacteriota bacterium]
MQALLVAVLLQLGAPAQLRTVSGTVTDAQGSTVPNAIVQLEVGGAVVAEAQTSTDGRFAFITASTDPIRLIVTATGFGQNIATIPAGAGQDVTIALQPAPFFEAVQVTSTRSDVARADPTVTAAVFPSSELLTSAPLSVDDALKMVPGFTLFPSSRVANPTSQTMMLRGLGGSGVNRSLVLADGVPLNDAFGGWIYWGKVPHAAIDRIEVVRGGGSDLYGADAVGGVVQILTVDPSRSMARVLVEAGNLETGRVSMFGGLRLGPWMIVGAGQWFTTEGYIPVAADERGAIERPAGSKHRSALASVTYLGATGWRIGARGNLYSEDRTNGTVVQVNDTDSRQASGEVAGAVAGGYLSAHVFGGTQGYDQTFSAASAEPPRATEDLNLIQRVPTRLTGGSVQWTRQWNQSTLLVGGEARSVEGDTLETRFRQGLVLGMSEPGGSQRVGSAFARVMLAPTDRLTLVTGAHIDAWRSASSQTSFSQTVGAFSPRLSFAYRLGASGVALRGSVAGGFRAPTLNELYRSFQIGNDVTLPNEALTPERLRTGDVGVMVSRGRASARATAFWSVLNDTITNVTLSTSPSLNVRQRQNADKMRASGVELEADVRLPAALSVALTSSIIDSRFAGSSRLRDFRVPQVSGYSVGINVRYDHPVWTASTQVRVTGPQYEDDVNTRRLRRATVVDAFGGRTLARRVMLFAAVENMFDAEYEIGRIPMRTLGLPRAVRTGFQVVFP